LELDPRNFFTLQQIALSYSVLRRYNEEAAVLDRALDIKPDDVDTKVARVSVDFDATADTRPSTKRSPQLARKIRPRWKMWPTAGLIVHWPSATPRLLVTL
jgi:hypothetical protein